MINRQQMELGLGRAAALRAPVRLQGRAARARWWFGQMHLIVERARDWHAIPPENADEQPQAKPA